ncbi:hypothetical protein DQ04_04531020 [Trypanosoma grayi]|uniref:hypothetical protein n=1 Tax=Trypanosoma grayi TaxID=71804 RepID=UPI0004F467FD|nr:hypothetical protein DQ04_04531020 [Trypanosoma grayi]KEG09852.1 hypothetical protein DQ04_04531020 [Trypanosoma grayi]
MRRGDEEGVSSAFVPKLSINRSSESYQDPSSSDYRSYEGRAPAAAAAVDGTRRHNANSSGANSGRGTTSYDYGGYDQGSPQSRNNSTFFGTNLHKANEGAGMPRPEAPYNSNIVKGYSSNNNSTSNSRNNKNKTYSAPLATYVDARTGMRGFSRERGRSTSAPAMVRRVLRRDAEQYALSEPPESSLDNISSSSTTCSGETSSSDAESTLFDIDAEPVVPVDVLCASPSSSPQAFAWARHPRHVIVLSLLRSRGMFLPRHIALADYHMSEAFLHYIDLCCRGSYFVRYQANSSPKERFFTIRMIPRDLTSRTAERVPCLAWTMHRTGVQVVGFVPLEQLVGITVNVRSASFRPHMTTPQTIKGPRVNSQRARLPTNGAFSLWFCDRSQRTARSVDLLTCNPTVLEVWMNTFKGFVSVNSSSLVHVPLTSEGISTELDELTREAQNQVARESEQLPTYR